MAHALLWFAPKHGSFPKFQRYVSFAGGYGLIRKLAGFKNVPWSFLMVSRTCSLQKIAGNMAGFTSIASAAPKWANGCGWKWSTPQNVNISQHDQPFAWKWCPNMPNIWAILGGAVPAVSGYIYIWSYGYIRIVLGVISCYIPTPVGMSFLFRNPMVRSMI